MTAAHVSASEGAAAAEQAILGDFNLLPYRERLAQALRRRRVAQCGVAMLLGVLGAGLWTGAAVLSRWRVDAERASVETRLRQLQPQVAAATRAVDAAAAIAASHRAAARKLSARASSTAPVDVMRSASSRIRSARTCFKVANSPAMRR